MECNKCEHRSLYDDSHKYPFHCYRPGTNNPAIMTEPYWGKIFKEPDNKKLKKCKFYKEGSNGCLN